MINQTEQAQHNDATTNAPTPTKSSNNTHNSTVESITVSIRVSNHFAPLDSHCLIICAVGGTSHHFRPRFPHSRNVSCSSTKKKTRKTTNLSFVTKKKLTTNFFQYLFLCSFASSLLLYALFDHLKRKEQLLMFNREKRALLSSIQVNASESGGGGGGEKEKKKVCSTKEVKFDDYNFLFGDNEKKSEKTIGKNFDAFENIQVQDEVMFDENDLIGSCRTPALLLHYILPTDVFRFGIFPFLTHVERLTAVKCINRKFHFLVRLDYEQRVLLLESNIQHHRFWTECLVELWRREWRIQQVQLAQNSLLNLLKMMSVKKTAKNRISVDDYGDDDDENDENFNHRQRQSQLLLDRIAGVESSNRMWSLYQRVLLRWNLSEWHDEVFRVMDVYRYGVRLCCQRPKLFFSLLVTKVDDGDGVK